MLRCVMCHEETAGEFEPRNKTKKYNIPAQILLDMILLDH